MMHKMLLSHDAEKGIWGDCHRTAIAAMLGLHPSVVPHFYREGPTRPALETIQEINNWLRQNYGLRQIDIAYPGETSVTDVLGAVSASNPGAVFMLGGTSSAGVGHTVLCWNGEIGFNPSNSPASRIVGPMEDGYWWVSFLCDCRAEAAAGALP